MRLKSIVAALAALLFATAVAAQVPAPPPTPPVDPENVLLLDLSTGGRVAIQLRPDVAPHHVERIKTLTRQHFYDGLKFHRVIDGFMAQTGDPQGTGEGGSQLPDLEPEFNALPHVRGTISMARASALNSANSQFFIMLAPRFTLDGKYTAFGRVLSGMAYVDAIEKGEPPANPSRILQASIAADNVPPPPPGYVPPEPIVPAPAPAAPGESPASPDASQAPAPAPAAPDAVAPAPSTEAAPPAAPPETPAESAPAPQASPEPAPQ
jgi:cyclophilin family peptidyl-prolyl cis-trans isomerase